MDKISDNLDKIILQKTIKYFKPKNQQEDGSYKAVLGDNFNKENTKNNTRIIEKKHNEKRISKYINDEEQLSSNALISKIKKDNSLSKYTDTFSKSPLHIRVFKKFTKNIESILIQILSKYDKNDKNEKIENSTSNINDEINQLKVFIL